MHWIEDTKICLRRVAQATGVVSLSIEGQSRPSCCSVTVNLSIMTVGSEPGIITCHGGATTLPILVYQRRLRISYPQRTPASIGSRLPNRLTDIRRPQTAASFRPVRSFLSRVPPCCYSLVLRGITCGKRDAQADARKTARTSKGFLLRWRKLHPATHVHPTVRLRELRGRGSDGAIRAGTWPVETSSPHAIRQTHTKCKSHATRVRHAVVRHKLRERQMPVRRPVCAVLLLVGG